MAPSRHFVGDVDGALVGGASLDAQAFAAIVGAAALPHGVAGGAGGPGGHPAPG